MLSVQSASSRQSATNQATEKQLLTCAAASAAPAAAAQQVNGCNQLTTVQQQPQQQQQQQQQQNQPSAKRKRAKLSHNGNQQRRQSSQISHSSIGVANQRRLSSGNISTSASGVSNEGAGQPSMKQDESVWIFGLINNIEQLLTTFNAINTNSSSSSPSSSCSANNGVAAALASRPNNSSGSSTPSSSSSTFSSTLSSPQSSPAAIVNAGACLSSATIPVQHLASAPSGAAAQTLPRSPMSRQIKFHEYKGPPSSKRQHQQLNQNQQQAQKQQTSITTNNITVAAQQQQQQQLQLHAKATTDVATIAVVGSSTPKESVKSLAQKSNRISSSKPSHAAPGQQQQSSPSAVGLLNQVQVPTTQASKTDRVAEFGVSLQQSHLQQQQQQQHHHHHHQSLVNFNFSEPLTNGAGCYGNTQSDACQTNLMPVQTQAHILHHPQQQKEQQCRQQQQLVRLTSGPQCTIIQQQPSFAISISQQQQQTVASDSILVGGEDMAAASASPSIEATRHDQQQQQQQHQPHRQTASGKIDLNESYHPQHNHKQHYLHQQHVQQLHLQTFSNQLPPTPSTFMIHTLGHGSSNGSFVGRQLYSPIQATQPQQQQQQQQLQQNILKIQSSPMNSIAAVRSAVAADLPLRDYVSIKQPNRQQVQQHNINYRKGAVQERFDCVPQSNSSYSAAPFNQFVSTLDNDGSCMLDDVDSLAVFGPDSDEIDACDIEPSIGFSHESDELLFSEFIDLQDVPMNVDESDWLKKFLPPCSMN